MFKIKSVFIGFIGLFMFTCAFADENIFCPKTITCKSTNRKDCTFSPQDTRVTWFIQTAVSSGTHTFTQATSYAAPSGVHCQASSDRSILITSTTDLIYDNKNNTWVEKNGYWYCGGDISTNCPFIKTKT